MRIMTIVGARPQFIKAVMVTQAIAEHNHSGRSPQIRETIIHTGQHYDRNMSEIFFKELKIPEPAVNLNVGSGNHGETTGRMLAGIEKEILFRRPALVMVYGDTNSTLAGALAASKQNIPVAHVEAGLRSFNKNMPEEVNRVLTDHISTLLFCPSEAAVSNLAVEGVFNGVYNTGDVMYDASVCFGRVAEKKSKILDRHELTPKKYALATVHRAENTDDDATLLNIMKGLADIGKAFCPVIFPLHPRTRKALFRIGYSFYGSKTRDHILFLEPLSFLDMIMLEKNAKLILTDSGGVQKESFFHGVPCITLRNETEWMETVECGWNQLAGADPEKMISAVNFKNRGQKLNIYGDGSAGKIIVQRLIDT